MAFYVSVFILTLPSRRSKNRLGSNIFIRNVLKYSVYPRVAIIVLNWNGWEDTIECLESVYQINYSNYDVIVVDNNSTDDSIAKIKEYCNGMVKVESKFFEYIASNKPIRVFEISENNFYEFNVKLYHKFDENRRIILIKNKKNRGFAGGNNVGIKFSIDILNSKYVLILNNDTVVTPNFLSELVRAAEKESQIGIVGPKVLYYNSPNIINSAGTKINLLLGVGKNVGAGEIDRGQYDEERYVDSVFGACMLVRDKVFREIGYFDESFFMLLEETDFCIRSRKSGYRILYQPRSVIYHKGSISRKKVPLTSLYYSHRNRLLLLRKHNKLNYLNVPFILLRGTASIFYYLLRCRNINYAKCIINAYLDGLNYCSE